MHKNGNSDEKGSMDFDLGGVSIRNQTTKCFKTAFQYLGSIDYMFMQWSGKTRFGAWVISAIS